MDRHNQHDRAAKGRHPYEATLSERYRRLEGFHSSDNRLTTFSRDWEIGNLNRSVVPLSEANLRTVAINIFHVFSVLLVSSVTLGLVVILLNQSVKRLASKISLYPVDFVWPPRNSEF